MIMQNIPIVELNHVQIDNMFNLVDLDKNDIFYDLGSGTGKVVIAAHKKRKVRKAIGIEYDKQYYEISKTRKAHEIQNANSLENTEFWYGDYSQKQGNQYVFDISDATVVYNSLAPSGKSSFYDYQFSGRNGVKIVKKDLPLVGYKPVKTSRQDPNSLFFLMLTPLDKYRIHSKSEWARYVMGKNSTIDDVFEYYKQLWEKNNYEKIPNKIETKLEDLIKKYLPEK